MCPQTNTPQKGKNCCASVVFYEPPQLKENRAGVYIEFRAYDPEQGKLRRKTIKLNHIKGLKARRTYGRTLIKRLSEQLALGWSPWIQSDINSLSLMADALDRYESFVDKMNADGLYRKETYVGYKSYLKILRYYIDNINRITFLYQFDQKFCSAFLDYVFIERNVGAQTRNNYLGFLKVLSGYFVDKGLLNSRPTDGISPISKRLYHKERGTIPTDTLGKITSALKEKDPYFLVACYLLYYCFIRPVEMTRLKIGDFNIKESVVTVPASSSKNHKTQTVTLPKKVLQYMFGLGIFAFPISDYLFSSKLMPGPEAIDTKIFRDHWEKLRKHLKLPKTYKFYSLKDTGITEMCDNNMTTIAVRDQARHSSLQITDIYTRHDNTANSDIIKLDGSL